MQQTCTEVRAEEEMTENVEVERVNRKDLMMLMLAWGGVGARRRIIW